MMVLLCRKTTVTAQDLGADGLLLHGQYEDENHLIDAQVTVERETGRVLSAYADMGRTPYGDVCRLPLAGMGRLVGTAIGKGATRRVTEALGGPDGCVHLVDLVIEVFKTYIPSMARLEEFRLSQVYRGEGLPPDRLHERIYADIRDLGYRLLPDTCVAYRLKRPDPDAT